MTFFARPNLDNVQFEQLKDSTLTLSGQPQIATTTGLTLTTGSTGSGVILTASGASINNQVLTYDSVENVIKLKDPTASGGTGIYTCDSPSTIEVGGMSACTDIYGCQVNDILQCILVPTVDPVVSAFFNSLSIPPPTTYEVGCQPTIIATSGFDRGCVLSPVPPYCSGSDKLTGLPSSHVICAFGDINGVTATTTNLVTGVTFNPTISYPSNYIYSCVNYSSGATPVYRSDGSVYSATAAAGATSNKTCLISGIYPYYWGKETCATRPAVTQDLVTGGTKVVTTSTGTVTVNFNTVSSEYSWLAIPEVSASKNCWYVTALSNGPMLTSASDKYPDECILPITSSDGCWSSINYKVYMSKAVGAITLPMEFRN